MCFKSLFNGYRYDFYKNIADKGLPVDFFPRIELHKGCMVNENSSFVIGPQGELYKCWNDFNSPDKTIGNIKDKNLSSPSSISRNAIIVYYSPFVMEDVNGSDTRIC